MRPFLLPEAFSFAAETFLTAVLLFAVSEGIGSAVSLFPVSVPVFSVFPVVSALFPPVSLAPALFPSGLASVPAAPVFPVFPAFSVFPVSPALPAVPAFPVSPALPAVPAFPVSPALPAVPSFSLLPVFSLLSVFPSFTASSLLPTFPTLLFSSPFTASSGSSAGTLLVVLISGLMVKDISTSCSPVPTDTSGIGSFTYGSCQIKGSGFVSFCTTHWELTFPPPDDILAENSIYLPAYSADSPVRVWLNLSWLFPSGSIPAGIN